jgi:hypothetical protein
MQILALAIYKGERRRVVRFKPGQINVVTGWSETGKSAILEIVEYCLGRSEPTFARGALDAVEWYGLLLEHRGARTFIARPAPADGAASATSAMVRRGAKDVLEAHQLATDMDTKGLRETLGNLIGVESEVAGATAAGREWQRPTIGQALLFCFQRQTEISKPDQLFHRANEEHIPQTIREALPYFLGAVGSEHVARRFRLIERRRDLRRAQAELEQLQQTQLDADVRAGSLLTEVRAVGLLEDADQYSSPVAALRAVLTRPDPEMVADQDSLLREQMRIRASRREVAEQLRQVQEKRASLLQVREDRNAFRTEVGEQHARLLSLGLMSGVADAQTCPLCAHLLEPSDTTTADLAQHVADLDQRLDMERSLEPFRQRKVAELRTRARLLKQQLAQLREAETSLLGNGPNLVQYTELAERRAYVRGRVSQYLEGVAVAEPARIGLLDRRVAKLTEEIAGLEELLDPTAVARNVESKLHFVNDYMTTWARQLDLEHSQDGVGLSLQDLTLVANNRRSPIPLLRIGSAANQVGYHVVAHLALHRWFIEEKRPVPRFLFLDQPEQAYYPEDMPANIRDLEDRLSERDQAKVLTLYTFLRDVTASFSGALQTIVVGHWNPAGVDWFPEARVANWREGEALVPMDWKEQPDLGTETVPENGS